MHSVGVTEQERAAGNGMHTKRKKNQPIKPKYHPTGAFFLFFSLTTNPVGQLSSLDE